MEPLSLSRPKCLLPHGDATVLSLAAERALSLRPRILMANATRRPDLVKAELRGHGDWSVSPEPVPLGAVGTLAGAAGALDGGTLLVSNTDMVTDPDMQDMLFAHREAAAQWTLLCGAFPGRGGYGGLPVGPDGRVAAPPEDGGRKLHYYGISLMEPPVLDLTAGCRGGLFDGLLPACLGAGLSVRAHVTGAGWLDMGSLELLLDNILAGGSFVSPKAHVSPEAKLRGRFRIGSGCLVGAGALVEESVMLDGSSVDWGVLFRAVLPWGAALESEGAIGYEA